MWWIMYSPLFTQIFRDCIDVYASYSESGNMITLQEFQSFLIQEQQDAIANDEREVSRFMRDYLQDSQRNVQEPFFTTTEVWEIIYASWIFAILCFNCSISSFIDIICGRIFHTKVMSIWYEKYSVNKFLNAKIVYILL